MTLNSADFTFRNFPTSSLVRFSAFRFQSWSAISLHVHIALHKHLESKSVFQDGNTFKDPGELHFSPYVHKHLKSALQVQLQLNYGLQPKTGFVKFDK